jgi:hypothetical protein
MKGRLWEGYIESYLSDLRIVNKNNRLDLEILRGAYQSALTPLTSLAISQGFMANWFYG